MTKKSLALAVSAAMVAITLVVAACGGVEDYAINCASDTSAESETHYAEWWQIPWDIYDTIMVNDEIIDAPAPVWYTAQWGGLVLTVPLRPVAEALGWSVDWSEENQEVWVDNVRLRIGENEGFSPEQEWRDGMFHLAAAPTIIDDEIFVPASFFPAQVFERQLIIGGDSKSRIAGIIVGVGSATEERLNEFVSYVQFVDYGFYTGSIANVLIIPSEPLRDFRWFQLGYSQGEDFYIYVGSELYAPGDITPEHPFVVNWGHFGTMPQRGISFVDDYGVTRYFVLSDNQASFEESPRWNTFREFTPGVAPW